VTAGNTYEYQDNNFAGGISHCTFQAVGDGPRPIFRCVNQGSMYQNGPLGIKGGIGALAYQGEMKDRCALIEDAMPGENLLLLKDASDAGKITGGRWHLVVSGCQQTGGYPPNCTYVEFVKVVSVDGNQVLIDRKLRFKHGADWYEKESDQGSLGKARLLPFDTDDNRTIERLRFEGIEFARNPNGPDDQAWRIMYCEGIIDLSFHDCVVFNNQHSMSKHVSFTDCLFTHASEFDKLGETITIDSSTCDPGVEIGAATGYQWLLLRNSFVGYLKASPRQITCVGETTIATETNGAAVGYTWNGPVLSVDLRGATIEQGAQEGAGDRWAWTPQTNKDGNFFILQPDSWDGNWLRIPDDDQNFEAWLTAMHFGLIVAGGDGHPPYDGKPWGYVTDMSSEPGVLRAEIAWINSDRPTSGNLYRLGRWSRLNLTDAEVFTWNNPMFACQIAPGQPDSWGWPEGYPYT
jgi:hypothetical protein